ncbi:AAA family ATPase [Pseudogemmobacter sonorensis]|uniref:AAA family ATPase n=1 Tax=Pseudogemmobacter sonorensis TaxID=2989681 RepID=UPI00369BF00A
MSRIPFIHARFPAPSETESALVHRLRDHLRNLRVEALRQQEAARPAEEAPEEAGEAEDDPDTDSDMDAFDLKIDLRARAELTSRDSQRINRRAARLHKARMAATGLSHLKKEDRERLEVLKDGVRLAVIPSEHRADELAAELHDEFRWLGAATEVVWHAMRRSVREGWPGLRLPPLLLDGNPGIGKSVWARRLGGLIGTASMVFEATSENASFGLVGSQRGWSNAAPGRLLQTILQERVGNPVVIVDEVEKAGTAESNKGRSFDLASSLLPLLEPATAGHWTCPFYEIGFDMGWICWVLTSNDWRKLPDPLISRCPPIRLPDPTLEQLIDFARREGQKRGLSAPSVEAVAEALLQMSRHVHRLSLRSVIRMLDLAERLEAEPIRQ